MRIVAGQFRELTQGDLAFARQIGCAGITVNKPDFDSPAWVDFLQRQFRAAAGPRPPMRRWSAMDLIQLRSATTGFPMASGARPRRRMGGAGRW